MDPTETSDSNPVSRQRLRHFLTVEYRSIAARRLGVTAEWRTLDWIDNAACTESVAATEVTCRRCRVVAECLAAAVATDDTAEWRGGLDRADRERLWSSLERTYRDIRDLEAMRLDVTKLANQDHRSAHVQLRFANPTRNGARS